jgi:hypothetical protein
MAHMELTIADQLSGGPTTFSAGRVCARSRGQSVASASPSQGHYCGSQSGGPFQALQYISMPLRSAHPQRSASCDRVDWCSRCLEALRRSHCRVTPGGRSPIGLKLAQRSRPGRHTYRRWASGQRLRASRRECLRCRTSRVTSDTATTRRACSFHRSDAAQAPPCPLIT